VGGTPCRRKARTNSAGNRSVRAWSRLKSTVVSFPGRASTCREQSRAPRHDAQGCLILRWLRKCPCRISSGLLRRFSRASIIEAHFSLIHNSLPFNKRASELSNPGMTPRPQPPSDFVWLRQKNERSFIFLSRPFWSGKDRGARRRSGRGTSRSAARRGGSAGGVVLGKPFPLGSCWYE
jgi:hypothetical protein